MIEDLVTYLKNKNMSCGSRISPIKRAHGEALPALVYQQIAGPRVRSHSGDSGLVHPTIQFTAWGKTYAQAKTLAKQLIAALESYHGTTGSTIFEASFVELEQDGVAPDANDFFVTVDVIIWHGGTS